MKGNMTMPMPDWPVKHHWSDRVLKGGHGGGSSGRGKLDLGHTRSSPWTAPGMTSHWVRTWTSFVIHDDGNGSQYWVMCFIHGTHKRMGHIEGEVGGL